MSSGEFHSGPIDSITIARDTRQRKKIDDIENLAKSIAQFGLIHPILVTRENVLVAGERRLTACRKLGWTSISFQFIDEIDPKILKAVELEENIRRKSLSWQEQNDAMAEIYALYKELEPESTDSAIAARMGEDPGHLSSHLLVKKERTVNPRLETAATFHTARNTARAAVDRRLQSELDVHYGPRQERTSSPIIQTSFHDWAPVYDGPKFNFLHCDFPYGIDSQSSGANPSGYDDSLTVYLELLRTLATHLDNFCAPHAHIIFWYSPKFHSLTWENLKLLDGFTFDEVPLIWHKSDGRGIAPDPSRRPRRVYETAFFGWRGDRKIVALRDNVFSCPSSDNGHPHEKAELALGHFFQMVVDSTTRMLDPTCGSASALRAATAAGASTVCGLERDPGYAALATETFANWDRLRRKVDIHSDAGADDVDDA